MQSAAIRLTSTAGCALTLALAMPTIARSAPHEGAVYVMTNQASANAVMAYDRAADGGLTYLATYPTGGAGAGSGADPLGSQGALALSGELLLAANPGSDDISVFEARGAQLVLLERLASGGTMPVSLAVHGDLVYALNAAGTPNISGFSIDRQTRHLAALPGSQRPLAGGSAAAPAEIHFADGGEAILVTEKGTQQIDTYEVDARGYAGLPSATPASAATPFGFAVTRRGYAVVSEAGAGAVSSYERAADGSLNLLSGPILLGQTAPCWVAATRDGKFAYSANAGSGSISALAIGADGTLSLLDAAAASLAAPLDMALSEDSRFLYAREGNGALTGFAVQADGALSFVTIVSGIPAGAQGIAAR